MGELVKDEDGEEIERYEVQLCGMKDDGEGGLTYCDSTHETPEILEDEDFNT